jgi:DNA mismatch endonuclease (patch repair protein)
MANLPPTAARSYNMSRIKAANTKPEMLVRRYLHAQGYRYTLHNKNLPGKPDLVLSKYKTIIFVNGCFWHGHKNCKYYTVPKTNTDWWLNKINRNITNDIKVIKALKQAGWKVLVIWECKLKPAKIEKTLASLLKKLA